MRMRLKDSMRNYIVYLEYVLAGIKDSADAEVLRPIHAQLSLMEATLSGELKKACRRLDGQVCQWLDVGLSLSRQSIVRVLESLERFDRDLNRLSPVAG